jgi:hypothetical protein
MLESLKQENARLREELRLARNQSYMKDGVEYHKCGDKVSDCRQRNGKWWCEVCKEPAINGDGYDG